MSRHVHIWQFDVRPERQAEFVRQCGPRGTVAERNLGSDGELTPDTDAACPLP